MTHRAYYADGTTADFATREEWTAVPAYGLQVVRGPHKDTGAYTEAGLRRHGMNEVVCYVWDESWSHPFAVDRFGLIGFLVQRGLMPENQSLSEVPVEVMVGAGVKFGESMDDEAFGDLYRRAWEDPDIPQQTSGTRWVEQDVG